jgi:hypothetical protein
MIRRVAVATFALGCAGCSPASPSGELTGSWSYRSAGHIATTIAMSIEQRGDTITGVACAHAAGMVFYRGVPVTGEDPRMGFVVSASAVGPNGQFAVGDHFLGRRENANRIVGTYNGNDIFFTRVSTPACPD